MVLVIVGVLIAVAVGAVVYKNYGAKAAVVVADVKADATKVEAVVTAVKKDV